MVDDWVKLGRANKPTHYLFLNNHSMKTSVKLMQVNLNLLQTLQTHKQQPSQFDIHSTPVLSKFKYKALCLAIECQAKCTLNLHEDQLIEQHIICAEDARTASAKADATSPSHVAIDRAHSSSKTPYPNPILRKSINSSLALTTSLR